MQLYKDIDGDSGIHAYELGPDSIAVRFKNGSAYLYTCGSAGFTAIQAMKQLAVSGDGLNTYINKYVRKRYASRLQ